MKAIKAFIATFKSPGGDVESAGQRVRQFLASSDASFRAHPLWAGEDPAPRHPRLHIALDRVTRPLLPQDIYSSPPCISLPGSDAAALDAAGEGLEKYVMTKLYDKVFQASEEDREGVRGS